MNRELKENRVAQDAAQNIYKNIFKDRIKILCPVFETLKDKWGGEEKIYKFFIIWHGEKSYHVYNINFEEVDLFTVCPEGENDTNFAIKNIINWLLEEKLIIKSEVKDIKESIFIRK